MPRCAQMNAMTPGRRVNASAPIRPLEGVSGESVLTDELSRIGALYRDEGDRIWQALLAYSGDPDVASDALSEALTQAIARGDELRDPSAWVWTASFRIAAGELKARGHLVPLTGEAGTYHMPEPVPHLLAALAQISDRQRVAVLLHDFADRPTSEIAELFGTTKTTVRVHLNRGRKRLRDILEPTDD